MLGLKKLVHHNCVELCDNEMTQWLYVRAFRIGNVLLGAKTDLSCSLVKYFASFGNSVRCVHFRDECNEANTIFLVACYCKHITILRCTNVTISFYFHAILLNNRDIKEIWIQDVKCTVDELMNGLSLHKLELLSVEGTECPRGFPWSKTTFSDTLKCAECTFIRSFTTDLEALTRNCANLRSFSWKSDMDDADLKAILGNRPELVNLSISCNEIMTDEAIHFVAQSLPYLRTLNIQKCQSLTSASLLHIAEHCSQLEVLYIDIENESEATERAVEIFSQKCTKIEYLNIYSEFILCHTTCTASLLKNFSNLHTLVVNKYENITRTTRELCAIVNPRLKILVHDKTTEYNVLTMPI